MANYWMISRPKRKLNSVPEVLAIFIEVCLDAEWRGNIDVQLEFESALEKYGIKRDGDRRDQRAGGARTYIAWLKSLGLIFEHEKDHNYMLTLAGEALIDGKAPVDILTHQIIKFQYPSPYSISGSVNVNSRFKIRPFRFILKLLLDERIQYITEEEIAKIIIVEAENETKVCYESVVDKILRFRVDGDDCLDSDFFEKYSSSRSKKTNGFNVFFDIANTIKNWLEYTQLISLQGEDKKIYIADEKHKQVESLLTKHLKFIDRYKEQEYFQRKFGVFREGGKDTRNLNKTKNITATMVDKAKIDRAFLSESFKYPILSISEELIDKIAQETGCKISMVETYLYKKLPKAAVNSFLTNYNDMAFSGTKKAKDFEKATVMLFKEIFGFEANHVGSKGKTPDVEIISIEENYTGIIDNKAYEEYSINNDQYNRMVHNYIKDYKKKSPPLTFFLYIAAGFGVNIDKQIKKIHDETCICGACISVSNLITLIKRYIEFGYNHKTLLYLFTINREIHLKDIYGKLE